MSNAPDTTNSSNASIASTATTVLQPGDTIIVSGAVRDAERFADLR